MRFSNSDRPRRGFTLIEVMIVVVIIGMMAALVTYATTGYVTRAKKQRARSDLATYSGAVDAYYLAKGGYPTNDDGLRVLVPEFIKVLQNDPWGHPYQYLCPGKDHPYDVVCYGADGREGGSGADADMSNWDPEVLEAKPK
jgi:general secretion pathway protein G